MNRKESMSKKGQINTAALIVIFLGVVFAFALIPAIYGTQAQVTTIQNSSNVSYTFPANGTVADLAACGQGNVTNVVIYNYTNSSGDVAAPAVNLAGNFSVNRSAGSTGYIQSVIRIDTLGAAYIKSGYKANVTCQYEPAGYNTDSGARGIAGMWGIFVALAVAAFAIGNAKFEWVSFD